MEIGDKFGHLTAVQESGKNSFGGLLWLFKCTCGKEHVTRAQSVKSGRAKSCGCGGIVKGRCTKCQTDKPLSEFRVHKSGRVDTQCNKCRIARHSEYSKQRYKTDPKFVRLHAVNHLKTRSKKLPRITIMFHALKNGAKKRGLAFILLKSDIEALATKQDWHCAKTGIPLDLTAGEGQLPFGPTIDRIDNSRGYEPGNIQLVCYMYNVAKNRFSDADVLMFANALANGQRNSTINNLKLRVVA